MRSRRRAFEMNNLHDEQLGSVVVVVVRWLSGCRVVIELLDLSCSCIVC